jgi:hypothetical protein
VWLHETGITGSRRVELGASLKKMVTVYGSKGKMNFVLTKYP